MALSNLSLGNLYKAWNGTARTSQSSSLNAANGMAGTAVSMSSFTFTGVTVTQPFTYIVENSSENVTFAFTGGSVAFDSRVKTQTANYYISVNDNTYFTVGSPASGGTTAITAKSLATAPYSGSNATTLTAYFDDSYNVDSTGNNKVGNASTKTIYSVDSYNSINSDILCVSTDTDIMLIDGTNVKASDLYIGDTIKTYVPTGMPEWLPNYDEAEWYWWYQSQLDGSLVNATISNIYYSFIDEYVSLNNGELKCTKAHPLFAYDSLTETYQFTRAEDVEEGDSLIKYNPDTNEMESILVTKKEFKNETLEIATITVDVAHTYLSNGFLSHNKGSANAPIPWQNLVCYCDLNFAASYQTATSASLNDVAGYATGWNLIGGSNPGVALPVFNATSPKSLTFASGKYGIKQGANASGTGNAYFNTTSANGYTIIAWVNGSAGDILSRGTDYKVTTSGNIAFTSTPNGNLTAATQTLTGWHMIAVTAGAGTTTIYNNNVSVASGASTAAATTGTSDIYLMQNNTGNLGAFFFYQRALSSTEIGYIWNNLKGRFGL